MNNKIISIDMGIDFSYMIAMSRGRIDNMFFIPKDYKADEIMEIALCDIQYSGGDIICYDQNGIGAVISDATINNPNFGCKNVMKPLNSTDIVSAGRLLDKAKEKLLDYALNSRLNGFQQIEFKKLCAEINNLEYKQNMARIVTLSKIDKNIGSTRAKCFLNGLYVLE